MIIHNMMPVSTYSLLRRICVRSGQRTVVTAASREIQNTEIEPFRTIETYPPNHIKRHLGKIYTMPSDVEHLLKDKMTNTWKTQIKCFAECGVLIRKPMVEITSYLEQTDYTKPINKYIIYGKLGVGKTTTLMHLLHYGLVKKFLILHVPKASNWFAFPKDTTDSTFMEGKIDLPIEAAEFLNYFKTLNAALLSELDLKITKDYEWTKRESTKCGEPLTNLIEFGIHRTKFACEIVNVLVNELKAASTAGKCKMLVVIDGFNAFTSDYTNIRDETKVYVPPSRISLTSAFLNSVNYNWCNGAAVLTVDIKANKTRRESEYPRYLLGKEGFETVDPFLPVCVENYDTDEFYTIMNYYEDRKWIRDITSEGKRELELLSNKNPLELWTRCKSL